MPALNWVNFDQAISWDQANAIAVATGGRLLINDHDPAAGENWPTGLADSIDENRYEFPTWFGISAVAGGGYRWVDGTTVDPAWAAQQWYPGGDPNADSNPNNDTQHPVLIGGPSWASLGDLSATDVRQAFIEYVDTRSVRGTNYDDAIFGGGGPGETVRTFGGDDIYRGLGGGKIYLGEGDDRAIIGELGFTNEWITGPFPTVDGLIFDGPGKDLISDAAAVNAAIDGDDDRFVAHRVSYADDTAGVTIVPFSTFPEPYIYQATGATGTDSLLAVEVVGGSGDDHIEGVPRIQGGAGNDYLAPGINDLSQSPYAEGNAGNDTLVASTDERTELRGGAGDDLLLLGGPAEVSGGAGADGFVFRGTGPVTIVDFSLDDRFDFTALTDLPGAELFDQGYLRVERAGGYTHLLFDADGGGDAFALLANLKGVFTQAQLESRIVGVGVDESSTTTGSVTERPDGAADENLVVHVTTGSILLSGLDPSPPLSFSVTGTTGPSPLLGSLSFSQPDPHTLNWNFQVRDVDLAALNSGETVTQTYNLLIDARITVPITITMTGADDTRGWDIHRVGYYDTQGGSGAWMAAEITKAGLTPVAVTPTAANLAGLDALVISNSVRWDENDYNFHATDIEAFVRQGGILIIHDAAPTFIGELDAVPTITGQNAVEDLGNDYSSPSPYFRTLFFTEAGEVTRVGPAGTVGALAIDHGPYLAAGFAFEDRAGLPILTLAQDPTDIDDPLRVAFANPYGQGAVVYDALNLELYAVTRGFDPAGALVADNLDIWAANVLASFTASAADIFAPP